MLNYYDFTAAASGAEFRISAPGTYLRYYSGSAGGFDSRLVVKCDARGLSVILKPGQAVRLAPADGVAVDWRLSSYARQADIAGFVVIGDGQLDDSRVESEVLVVDGGLARTLAQQAYLGAGWCVAAAAQYSHLQLWNPATSGVNLILESMSISTPVASQFVFIADAAQRAFNSNQPTNKAIGGGASLGQVRYETNAAQQGAGLLLSYNLAANQVQTINLREPVVLPPGRGANCICTVVNVTINANFEWFEQAQ